MPSQFALDAHQVRIWRCDLRTIDVPPLASLELDAFERRRAESFVFERDRRRYAAGRALLRALLARYLACEPRAVQLGRSPTEKPHLVQPLGARLRFNVSHCEDIYVAAFGIEHELGVDIEQHRQVADAESLAKTVFSVEEVTALRQASSQASAAFLRGWTRKEAYVKALGIGIGIELTAITVGLDPATRSVPAYRGMPEQSLAVHTVRSDDREHIAIACSTSVTEIVREEVSASLLDDLRLRPAIF